MSLPQKLIDPMEHGISMALTSLHDPVVPHNCSIHLSKTGIVVYGLTSQGCCWDKSSVDTSVTGDV